jgi:hypothetical protein
MNCYGSAVRTSEVKVANLQELADNLVIWAASIWEVQISVRNSILNEFFPIIKRLI